MVLGQGGGEGGRNDNDDNVDDGVVGAREIGGSSNVLFNFYLISNIQCLSYIFTHTVML